MKQKYFGKRNKNSDVIHLILYKFPATRIKKKKKKNAKTRLRFISLENATLNIFKEYHSEHNLPKTKIKQKGSFVREQGVRFRNFKEHFKSR